MVQTPNGPSLARAYLASSYYRIAVNLAGISGVGYRYAIHQEAVRSLAPCIG